MSVSGYEVSHHAFMTARTGTHGLTSDDLSNGDSLFYNWRDAKVLFNSWYERSISGS